MTAAAATTIIIYLHASPTPMTGSWVILDSTNQLIQSVEASDLSQITLTPKSKVYVVVPNQDIFLTQVELPKLSRQQLLQALPFALEDKLINDITELHFAIGDYQANGKLPVAIISKQKMDEWLSYFKELNISPRAFIPAVFIIPFEENNWHINIHNNECLVRTEKWLGFACEKPNLETLLESNRTEYPDNQPQNIITTELSEKQLLESITPDFSKLAFINLLQGIYRARSAGGGKRKWIIIAYLTAAWILLLFVSKGISLLLLNHHAKQIDTSINQIYKENFPNASSVVAPRERMTKKLRSAGEDANKNIFLSILAKVGQSLATSSGISIQNLDFKEHLITIEISADAFDNLDSFIRSLTTQGISVKQQHATGENGKVKATLLIRVGEL